MADEYGHVKISRKAYETDPFWNEQREFSRWEAWEDLIQMAAWKPHTRVVKNNVVSIDRGQLLVSERFLAERWSWGRTKVRGFLSLLVSMGRIGIGANQEANHLGAVITLRNYQRYQSAHTTERTTTRTRSEPTPYQREVTKKQDTTRLLACLSSFPGVHAREEGGGPNGQPAVEKFIDRVILLANRGMNENPSLGPHAAIELPHGGSRQAVADWLAQGCSAETIERVVYEGAKGYKPTASSNRISSLAYFEGPIKEEQSRIQANGTEVPHASRNHGRRAATQGRRQAAPAPSKYGHLVERSAPG